MVKPLPLNSPLIDTYDYIIVGGRAAGLTVAHRLSEDPNTTVLVLEAGPSDDGEDIVEIPGFIGHDIGGRYDWNLSTVPQGFLDNQSRTIPQGRALGGGTLLNGMLWSRGGQADYDDWVQLGNAGWSWADLLPYFKRSETYTPVSSTAAAEEYSIHGNTSVHGYSGPVNVSYPHYFWTTSANFFAGLNELNVPTAYDPNHGAVAGASFLPFDLDPVTQTRCTAKRAYYDSVMARSNLWVSTGQTVTQLLFANGTANRNASKPSHTDGNGQGSSPQSGQIFGTGSTLNITSADDSRLQRLARAVRGVVTRLLPRLTAEDVLTAALHSTSRKDIVGVEYAANASSTRRTVLARREVIIAAGALHTPQLLMLSGIGPDTLLSSLGIGVHVNLPGVGSNLQDHYPNELSTDQDFVDQAWTDYWTTGTGPLTSGAIDGVAFPSLADTSNAYTSIAGLARSQSPSFFLAADTDPSVVAGFAQQLPLLANALEDSSRAAFEIINANDGDLTVANMRPFSRGSVRLSSTDPFAPPLIDPRYGSNPIDVLVFQAAIAFNQRLITTNAMSVLDPDEVLPPANASSDEILQHIRTRSQTEYHVSGTAAMLPRKLGGVVDANLLVYGTKNLRIVDASVFPMVPAGHLQAIVYGVAEKVGAEDFVAMLADIKRRPTSSKLPIQVEEQRPVVPLGVSPHQQ
ncbi:hypothetical protein AMS68_004690 [Peltaster fructicola]|uniref:Glucose-methanol-choline oxidoreductase N-terminal domain-containing protein n=1 Tax=Peltaster fructicola TaxID=286661 RepID=A0A6H0XWP4_9PEZI|nr:hypothetical protein AMS68_004690 [Peltaster fructicola]